MRIYHIVHNDDLIEVFNNTDFEDSTLGRFMKAFHDQKVNEIILSLRFEMTDIIAFLLEAGHRNQDASANVSSSYQESTNLPSDIVEVKQTVEDYYAKKYNCRVKVIGPFDNEELEITRILKDSLNSGDRRKHYFLCGNVDADSKLVAVELDRKTPELPLEYNGVHIVFDSRAYKETDFQKYPGNGLFSLVSIAPSERVWETALSVLNSPSISETLSSLSWNFKTEGFREALTTTSLFMKSGITKILLTGGSAADRKSFSKILFENSDFKNDSIVSLDCAHYQTDSEVNNFRHSLNHIFDTIPFERFSKASSTETDNVSKNQEEVSGGQMSNETSNVGVPNQVAGKIQNDLKKIERSLIFIDNIDLIHPQFEELLLNAFLASESNNSQETNSRRKDLIWIFGTDSRAKLAKLKREFRILLLKVVVEMPEMRNSHETIVSELLTSLNREIIKASDMIMKGFDENFKLLLKLGKKSIERIASTEWKDPREMVDFVTSTFTESIGSAALGKTEISPTGELIASDSKVEEMLESLKELENTNETVTKDIDSRQNNYRELYRVDLDAVKDLQNFLDQIERDYLISAFKKFGRNQTKVGQELGYTQAMISRKIKSLNIPYKNLEVK